MAYIQQIAFVLVLAVAIYLLSGRIKQIRKAILLGRDADVSGDSSQRWRTMMLVAFGQQKMFKRIIPAFFHFLIYIGFVVINLEVLEFVLDGIFGTHRLFAPFLGGFYNVLMNIFEFLAMGVLLSCIVFLWRRNVMKIKRFHSREMTSWPRLDANLILVIEIILMLAIFTMNATDQILQGVDPEHYAQTGPLFFSGMLIPIFEGMSTSSLVFVERFAWWFHIVGILAFAIYVTYSKHLHIFLAFPNTYYSQLTPKGEMKNMDTVTNEVKMMLGLPVAEGAANTNPDEIGRFGAKDVTDLTWRSIMGSFACTECGRCTSECPANQTGKLLSPRKIMMDTRDRATEIVKNQGSAGADDGKSLLGDYISKEEINACTTCNACVEACPVNINPLEIILDLRRYVAMEESGSPASWNAMFQNVETNFAPWKFPTTDRFKWADDITLKD
ncbi:(Fe-S)-binding protein [Fulvivirga sedimenti]|uniref:(Fe-S)-binding protein n=1 Tax=Fulvivirga sedimenti TaxID=2879465 RepID=A0A9X1KZ54_9BACT|nr:(Fe-S)-binding protein [Fulvivirga sedimenti]MCA6078558.1 (Fe-S)-binding protein [Fulvivirga sedimenti]